MNLNRRDLFQRAGAGFGWMALQTMLAQAGLAESAFNPLAPKQKHQRGKAKSIIWLFMNGGPSHVDTWDYKPELQKRDGQALPGFDTKTGFFPDAVGPLMKSPFEWKQYGQSATWGSSLFPQLCQQVDKMAFIHSCFTESNNHSPALFMMNTGVTRMGNPSVGAWVTYGLGSESEDLPSFMVMSDPKNRGLPKGNASNWTAGFLPGVYQGTWLKPQGEPIANLKPPADMKEERQREQLNFLAALNREQMENSAAEQELAARINSFELAYRMQSAAPEAFDVNKEPEHVRKMYGLDQPHCSHMALQCLTARRLVERGVRFVQIYSGGMDNQLSWDGHSDILGNHGGFAAEVDQPFAALLSDLEQRGLLDDVLVVCAGEFGRLPVSQKGDKPGRDHNPHAFTAWLAGGGVKAGVHHGETDDVGHKAAVDRVSVHDLHATLLHLVGIDHEKLTFRYSGLDQKLVGVEPVKLVESILV